MASRHGLHFQAGPFEGAEGLALRGFYAEADRWNLERPLIYVNSAHVPLAVAATFCHEFTHYLSSRLLDAEPQPMHFFYDTAYASHLDDPAELAADAIVTLRGYPRASAVEIFATPWNWGLVARTGSLTGEAFEQVRVHFRKRGRFDFPLTLPAHQNLHYLAGMIHYAKLRWALLAEYDL